MVEFDTFNINDCIRVILTEKGKEILAQYYGGQIPDWFYEYYVFDEWYEFQLWQAMVIFGQHLQMGGTNPFNTTILIEHK